MPRAERSNSFTPSVRSTVATCWEMPDWVAFSRSAARVNEPSSHTAMTARICRSAILARGHLLSRKLMPERRIYYFGDGDHPDRIPANSTGRGRERGAPSGDVHGNGKLRHRRIGLAAAHQLGPDADVPDRAGAPAHEEA